MSSRSSSSVTLEIGTVIRFNGSGHGPKQSHLLIFGEEVAIINIVSRIDCVGFLGSEAVTTHHHFHFGRAFRIILVVIGFVGRVLEFAGAFPIKSFPVPDQGLPGNAFLLLLVYVADHGVDLVPEEPLDTKERLPLLKEVALVGLDICW